MLLYTSESKTDSFKSNYMSGEDYWGAHMRVGAYFWLGKAGPFRGLFFSCARKALKGLTYGVLYEVPQMCFTKLFAQALKGSLNQ